MPGTAQILDDIHEGFLPPRESLAYGESEKATVGRGTQRFFHWFAEMFREEIGSSPREHVVAMMDEVVRTATDRQSMIDDLRACVMTALEPLCEGFVFSLNKALEKNGDFREFRESFFQRLMTRRGVDFHGMPDGISFEKAEAMKRVSMQYNSISFGCSNVAHVNFSQMDVIPRVFHDEYGRLPDPTEYGKIASSLPRLMHLIASTHESVHEAIIDVTRGPQWVFSKHSPCYWPAYRQEHFRLEGTSMEMHPNIIEPCRQRIRECIENGELKVDEPRVGCPAFQIIPVIHKWCLAGSEKVMIPHTEKLMTLHDDKRMENAMANTGDWARFL